MRSSAPESMEDASDSANESDSDDSSADPLARPSRPTTSKAVSSDTRNQQSRKKAPNIYQTLHKVYTVPAEQASSVLHDVHACKQSCATDQPLHSVCQRCDESLLVSQGITSEV